MSSRSTLASISLIGAIVSSWFLSTANGQCVLGISDFIAREEAADISQHREYSFCGNIINFIGTLDFDYNLQDGQPMIPLRPNLHIKCGLDGSQDNNCGLSGGDIHLDGTSLFGVDTPNLSNITIEGFVFSNVHRYSLWGMKPGDITFIDCTFKENVNALAPLYLDYYDPENDEGELIVRFIGCSFNRNQFYGEGANPAIVTGNGVQNQLFFDRCLFEQNDYVFNNTKYETSSFLVETSGQLTMTKCCFSTNTVGVSVVAHYGKRPFFTADNQGFLSNGQTCGFSSRFETSIQFHYFSPACEIFQADECKAYQTSTPTVAPSDFPSLWPTKASSFFPTTSPSHPPSQFPSVSPSDFPTAPPTSSPTTSAPHPVDAPQLMDTFLPVFIADPDEPTDLDLDLDLGNGNGNGNGNAPSSGSLRSLSIAQATTFALMGAVLVHVAFT